MNPKRRLLTAMIAATAGFAFVGPAIAKHAHHSGAQLLGNKIKENGEHVIHHGGPHTVSVRVTNGKIAGMTVKHDTKGNLPVKKYKTTKKMAQTDGLTFVSYPLLAQAYSAGTVYIGYAYIDDYGDEQIYWWPYEMIVDGDTGAVEYIPYA
jgi:hypothetical protein